MVSKYVVEEHKNKPVDSISNREIIIALNKMYSNTFTLVNALEKLFTRLNASEDSEVRNDPVGVVDSNGNIVELPSINDLISKGVEAFRPESNRTQPLSVEFIQQKLLPAFDILDEIQHDLFDVGSVKTYINKVNNRHLQIMRNKNSKSYNLWKKYIDNAFRDYVFNESFKKLLTLRGEGKLNFTNDELSNLYRDREDIYEYDTKWRVQPFYVKLRNMFFIPYKPPKKYMNSKYFREFYDDFRKYMKENEGLIIKDFFSKKNIKKWELGRTKESQKTIFDDQSLISLTSMEEQMLRNLKGKE